MRLLDPGGDVDYWSFEAQQADQLVIDLERTSGNYKVMTELFNMPPQDYKRFLGFLRKYHCHMPFQAYRNALLRLSRAGGTRPA